MSTFLSTIVAGNSNLLLVVGNGIDQLIDAQQDSNDNTKDDDDDDDDDDDYGSARRILAEEESTSTSTTIEDEENTVDDDAIVQILYNEDFSTCNDETMQFYSENDHIHQAVRNFGDSANATWGSVHPLDLKLEFNTTLKDDMKEACKNQANSQLNITGGTPGYYAFAGDLNCTYKIEGGGSANTFIKNYANCVADTEACRAVDETEFLQIIMHSLGSACDGLRREGDIVPVSGTTGTNDWAFGANWVLAWNSILVLFFFAWI